VRWAAEVSGHQYHFLIKQVVISLTDKEGAMAGITFDHIFKRFGDVTVLKDMDEPLGSEVYAYVENGGKELLSRLEGAHHHPRRPAARPGARHGQDARLRAPQ